MSIKFDFSLLQTKKTTNTQNQVQNPYLRQSSQNNNKSMKNNTIKPTPEAKALSLYLMAFKNTKPKNKENAKRINKQWKRVKDNALSMEDYMAEVQTMLDSYGGYTKVVEDTVWHYVKKTGKWELEGNDQYCIDARRVADEVLRKRRGRNKF